jgi:hypothetical protein
MNPLLSSNPGAAMSDWNLELTRGDAVLADQSDDQSDTFTIGDEIRSIEQDANSQRRTIVYVRLTSASGGLYYYPLRFLERLGKYAELAGREQEFRLYKCPRFPDIGRRYTAVATAQVDYQNGTTRL